MADVANKTVLPRGLARKARSATESNKYPSGSEIPKSDRLSAVDGNTVRSLRQINRIVEALRLACRLDGTLSTAVFDMVQVANSGLSLKAYSSSDHQYDYDASMVAKSMLASMDTLYDYSRGFSDRRALSQVLETALREVILTGAVSGELVLNKARLPDRIQLVPFETLSYKSRGDGTKYPIQKGLTSKEIELDIPNFWIVESHLGADSPYPKSMLEASLLTIFYYAEFIEDMRRVVRRNGHSRTVATLNAEQVRAAAPESAQKTEAAMKAYMEAVRDELQTVISSLEPEDALVVYDVAQISENSSRGEKTDYAELMQTLAGMAATSLKSNPSILGLRLQGSQSLSNTESLIFLQVATAAQKAVSTFFSRALTLGIRLFGVDAYVKAKFNPINLRPEDELEAFKTMRQDRILHLLSLGRLTDEEANEEMGLPPLPPGAPRLSGTMFFEANNNRADEVTPNADPMGRALQPDTPERGGGRSK